MVQPQSGIKEKGEILEVALGKGIKVWSEVCHQGFSALNVLKFHNPVTFRFAYKIN